MMVTNHPFYRWSMGYGWEGGGHQILIERFCWVVGYLQDIRTGLVLCWRNSFVHFCLWQADVQPPQVPQEPDSSRNCSDKCIPACHGCLDCPVLSCRGQRLFKIVLQRPGSPLVVQLLPISSLYHVYRFFHLPNPPWPPPPTYLQAPAQAAPQMDHADSLC